MNKLRSDSAFCQLTPEQTETLEGWLFEERPSYPKVVERLKAEFGLETSLTGVRRFYKRLDVERSAQSLMDAAEMSGLTVQALKSGELKPAMLLFANKCLFKLLRQSPVPIKEVTTLLRAITSAEAHTMRQTIYEREQAELKERERVRKVEEGWRALKRQVEREEREEREQEAVEKASKKGVGAVEPNIKKNLSGGSPSPQPSPPGEGADAGAAIARVVPVRPEPSGSLAPRGTSGERAGLPAVALAKAGERCLSITPCHADEQPMKDAGAAWQPSVVEEQEYAESHVAEAAENRLAPRKIF